MDSMLPAFLVLLPSIPVVVVNLVGFIFSATKLGVYRKAASLGVGGFAGLLLGQLVHARGTLMALPQYRGSMSLQELGMQLSLLNLVGTVLTLAGLIVLLVAIFVDRDKKPSAM